MSEVLREPTRDGVALLWLNRPEQLNALSMSLRAALTLERKAFQLLSASEDRTEGMQAFAEKCKPRFKGK